MNLQDLGGVADPEVIVGYDVLIRSALGDTLWTWRGVVGHAEGLVGGGAEECEGAFGTGRELGRFRFKAKGLVASSADGGVN